MKFKIFRSSNQRTCQKASSKVSGFRPSEVKTMKYYNPTQNSWEIDEFYFSVLKRAFEAFEIESEHKIPTSEIGTVLEMLGKPQGGSAMAFLMDEFDPWSK